VNPVVIMGTLSYAGTHPTTLRVYGVTGTSFKVQIQEYTYLDTSHADEQVSWMVAEAGQWLCPEDGHIYSAGNTLVKNEWVDIEYGEIFEHPVAFSQIVSQNYPNSPMVTRQKDVGAEGFKILLQAEEARDVQGAETVSWFVINRQLEGDRYIQRTKKIVTHKAKKLKFNLPAPSSFATSNNLSNSFVKSKATGDEEIFFFAAMQTSHGMNTAGLRY